MDKLHVFLANLLFTVHCFIGVVILTGWLFSKFWIPYLILLISWLLCWLVLGYCPITKWEFLLRRKYNKNIDPNAEAIKYYMYKFFKINIPANAIFTGGIIVFSILVVLTIFIHIGLK